MHRFTRAALILALVSTALLLPQAMALPGDLPREEMEKLTGNWTVVSANKGGKAIEGEELRAMKVLISGNRLTIKSVTRDDIAIIVRVDPTKMPSTIDFSPLRGGLETEMVQGIYLLEGDSLKICFGRDPKERPADFATGEARAVLELKRDK
jgi:uncharacterized protein (TIGR03067 family)